MGILEAPNQIVNQAKSNPVMFALGAVGGSTILAQNLNAFVPKQTLLTVDKMQITTTDVALAATGAVIGAVGDKIPVVGKMIGQGGARAIGAGIVGGVVYNKIAQEVGVLPQLPGSVAAAGVFQGQGFSQAYSVFSGYGGYRSFSGGLSIG